MSSLPQFYDQLYHRLEELVTAHTTYLIEQRQADLPQMRAWQGTIHGLRLAQDVITEEYRKAFG